MQNAAPFGTATAAGNQRTQRGNKRKEHQQHVNTLPQTSQRQRTFVDLGVCGVLSEQLADEEAPLQKQLHCVRGTALQPVHAQQRAPVRHRILPPKFKRIFPPKNCEMTLRAGQISRKDTVEDATTA
jgi:hypothetical protein